MRTVKIVIQESSRRCLVCLVILGVWLGASGRAAVVVDIGQNFTGSVYNLDTIATPPDSNGAVGPNHFVEFINGRFSVYTKTAGTRVRTISDVAFWSQAGVNLANGWDVTDPRIVYDPSIQRWLAAAIDFDPRSGAGNHFLLAASAGPDPSGAWRGVSIVADDVTHDFADFPTLGLDATGVYLAGDLYDVNGTSLDSGVLVSIPKADLLAPTPSIARLTRFRNLDYASRGAILQPAVCTDGSVAGNVLAVGSLGLDFQPHSTLKACWVNNAAGPGATLTSSTTLTVAAYSVPLNPPQPDGSTSLDDGDARFSATVYRVGGVLFAAHGTEVAARTAIRWYRISATNHAVLESGTITHTNLHLFYPSIAANANGTVVIGFNGCSATVEVSAYAVVGETSSGVTTFGNPVLLKAGVASYQNLSSGLTSRWGDYSATSVDPGDPNRFWTIQMFPSALDAWSTQITELITGPLRLTIAPAGTNVLMSWPATAGGFQLQTAGNLPASNTWSLVTRTAVTNGNRITVLVPASASRQFFRLKQGP